MKIIDMSWLDVENGLEKLALEFLSNNENKEIMVVGVANGGIKLANILYEKLALHTDESYFFNKCYIKSQRANKKVKNIYGIKKILSILPLWTKDFLRIIEHYLLSVKSKKQTRTCKLIDIDHFLFKQMLDRAEVVILIDDAIDSGSSIKAVIEYIDSASKDKKIVTMALTSTMNNPLIRADYLLYEKILVRGPWSLDYE